MAIGDIITADPASAAPAQAEAPGIITADPSEATPVMPSGAAVAALEGAGSALTFGAAPWIERAFGRSPEAMLATKAEHPIAYGAGEVAGLAAPALLTAGSSLLGAGAGAAARAGAALSAPELIGAAGRAVEAAAGQAGLGGLGTAILSSGARWGTEGALFAAQNEIAKQALGQDPTRTAGQIIADVGLGGLLGAGLGAAGRGLLETAGAPLAEHLRDVAGFRAIKASGAIQSDIKRATQKLSLDQLSQIGREMEESGLVGAGMTPAKTYDAAAAMKAETGGRMGELFKALDQAGVPETPISDVLSPLTPKLAELQHNPHQQTAYSKFKDVLDQYHKEFEGGASLQDLHQIRRQIDEDIYGYKGSMDPHRNAYVDALQSFRGSVNDAIEARIDASGQALGAPVSPSVFGPEAIGRLGETQDPLTYWKALNRQFQVASYAQDWAMKGIQRAEGNNAVSLTELMSGLSGAVGLGAMGHGGVDALRGGALFSLGTHLLRTRSAGVLASVANRGARLLDPWLTADRSGTLDFLQRLQRDPYHQAEALSQMAGHVQSWGQRLGKAANGLVGGGSAPMALPGPELPLPQVLPWASSQVATGYAAGGDVTAPAPELSHPADGALSPMADAELAAAKHGASPSFAPSPAGVGWLAKFDSTDPLRRLEAVRQVAADPSIANELLLRHTAGYFQHAPGVVQQLHDQVGGALQWLASKAPQVPERFLLDAAPRYDRHELESWNHSFDTVTNPWGVFEHMKSGMLRPEHVEALHAVYPDLAQAAAAELLPRLARPGAETTPRRVQFTVGMLTGAPLSSIDSPQMIVTAQAAIGANRAREEAQEAQGQRAVNAKVAKFKSDTRLQSASDKLLSH